jgi:hypothetical protein
MTTWSFTLVGMRFVAADTGSPPVSVQDVENCSFMALFSDPANPHDKNAIEVRGLFPDGTFRKIGYVSKDTQPPPGSALPRFGDQGTVYEVYETWASTPLSLAVQVRLQIEKPVNYTHICDSCLGCTTAECGTCLDTCNERECNMNNGE